MMMMMMMVDRRRRAAVLGGRIVYAQLRPSNYLRKRGHFGVGVYSNSKAIIITNPTGNIQSCGSVALMYVLSAWKGPW